MSPDEARRLGVDLKPPNPRQRAIADAQRAAAGGPVQGWGATTAQRGRGGRAGGTPSKDPKRSKAATTTVGDLKPNDTGEQRLQVRLARALEAAGLLWFHSPNGEHRRESVAAKLKRMGVKRGVPDLLILTRPPNRPGLVGTAVELKAPQYKPNGPGFDPPWACPRVTGFQAEWLQALEGQGWVCLVGYTFDDVVDALSDLGYPMTGDSD